MLPPRLASTLFSFHVATSALPTAVSSTDRKQLFNLDIKVDFSRKERKDHKVYCNLDLLQTIKTCLLFYRFHQLGELPLTTNH